MSVINLLEFRPVTSLGRSFDDIQLPSVDHMFNLDVKDNYPLSHVPGCAGALLFGYSVSTAKQLGKASARLPLLHLGEQPTGRSDWRNQLYTPMAAIEALFGTDEQERYRDLVSFGVPESWARLLSIMPKGPEVPTEMLKKVEIAQVQDLLKWMAMSQTAWIDLGHGDPDEEYEEEYYDDDNDDEE